MAAETVPPPSTRGPWGGPTQADPAALRLAWFDAPDPEARERCLDGLLAVAAGGSSWDHRAPAIRHLIELVHLAGHASDRARLIEALGAVDHPNAVPALHAELHHPEAEVRRAALTALGRLGYPFGGMMVARWFSEREPSEEAPAVVGRALLTLAQCGHPSVEEVATRLWEGGQVDPATLHLALADSASRRFEELARDHVASPEAGIAAALHLAAIRAERLPQLLRPMLRSSDLAQVLLAERLIAEAALSARKSTAADDLVDLVGRRWTVGALARSARRLRVHLPEALVQAFRELTGAAAQSAHERRGLVRACLLVGSPELQGAVLDWAGELEVSTLAEALNWVTRPTPALFAMLRRLGVHEEDRLANAALRVRVQLFGGLLPDELAELGSRRPALMLEAVRGLLTQARDLRGEDRRTRLQGGAKRGAERLVRAAMASDDVKVRTYATYAVGNLGLTGLTPDVQRLLVAEQPVEVRQAAATALHELPPTLAAGQLVAWAAREPSPEVRFRLALALQERLDHPDGSADPRTGLGELVRTGLSDRADLQVLAIRLRGHLKETGAVAGLSELAADPSLARASAALAALRTQADPASTSTLRALTQAADPGRRRRAVEALERLPGNEAGEALVRVASEDSDLEVRRAALRALAVRRPGPASARELVPSGPSDPLLFELLQARAAAAEEGGLRDVRAIDDLLVAAIPAFDVRRMDQRCPDALRALRTATFLSASAKLPEGLDEAPPALFWAKGLELWLDHLTRLPRTQLRARLESLGRLAPRWRELQGQAVGWPRSGATPGWATLLDGLRDQATCLLLTGPLSAQSGLAPWATKLSPEEVGWLAHELVTVAHLRNPLTHRTAGDAEMAEKVRRHALGVAAVLVRLGG